MSEALPLSDPAAVAELGERIYQERYKEQYEEKHHGKFVAIDITSGEAYLGETSDEALQKAKEHNEKGLFHLIRVGFPGAFRVSYTAPPKKATLDWFPTR